MYESFLRSFRPGGCWPGGLGAVLGHVPTALRPDHDRADGAGDDVHQPVRPGESAQNFWVPSA